MRAMAARLWGNVHDVAGVDAKLAAMFIQVHDRICKREFQPRHLQVHILNSEAPAARVQSCCV